MKAVARVSPCHKFSGTFLHGPDGRRADHWSGFFVGRTRSLISGLDYGECAESGLTETVRAEWYLSWPTPPSGEGSVPQVNARAVGVASAAQWSVATLLMDAPRSHGHVTVSVSPATLVTQGVMR